MPFSLFISLILSWFLDNEIISNLKNKLIIITLFIIKNWICHLNMNISLLYDVPVHGELHYFLTVSVTKKSLRLGYHKTTYRSIVDKGSRKLYLGTRDFENLLFFNFLEELTLSLRSIIWQIHIQGRKTWCSFQLLSPKKTWNPNFLKTMSDKIMTKILKQKQFS